jgi:hypothetical protein
MLTLLVNKREFDFSSLKIAWRVSGIDELNFEPIIKISPDLFNTQDFFLSQNLVELFDDETLLFSGFTDNVDFSFGRNNTFLVKVFGYLDILKNSKITNNKEFVDAGIVNILNRNPNGIKFANYNLDNYQKIFSQIVKNDSYFSLLDTLSKRLGFDYWFDYQTLTCWLGTADKTIKITDSDIENGKVNIPSKITYKKDQIINSIQVEAGVSDLIGLEKTEIGLQDLLGYPVFSKIDTFSGNIIYYIKDEISIKNYGLRENLFTPLDIKTKNLTQKELLEISALLYKVAVAQIKDYKNPSILIDNLEFYQKKTWEEITLFNNFDIQLNDISSSFFAGFNSKMQIADISLVFEGRDSSEGFYNLSLVSFIDKNKREERVLNSIITKYNRLTTD